MGYEATILADSLSPYGDRLTTMQVTYPHAIHKDIMTHRAFSRNFQSFRAFPPEKVIDNILADPFVPEQWDGRVAGMGQGDAINAQHAAAELWECHIRNAVWTAREMLHLGLAKAQVNFVLQDLTWITGIISATDWANFFALRSEADNVRPEVGKIARMMHAGYLASEPRTLGFGEWHLPLIAGADWDEPMDDDETPLEVVKKVAVGRCARVSYLTHEGERDLSKDVLLHDQLRIDGHMSPFEHVARPVENFTDDLSARGSNFKGWVQYRKMIRGEHDYSLVA